MSSFLQYIYQDLGLIIEAIWNIFASFFNAINILLNFPMRRRILDAYSPSFSTMDWILAALFNIVLIGLIVMALVLLTKVLRKLFKFRIPIQENEKLKSDLSDLKREVLKLNYEKDKILAMKVSEMGMSPLEETNGSVTENDVSDEAECEDQDDEDTAEEIRAREGSRNTVDSPPVLPEDSRFFRLTQVDNYYKLNKEKPEYDETITLEELCIRYRNFAASRLKLFYDIEIMRYFISALGACRLIVLQGISGTGKTSLPYSFGKFLQHDSTIAAVQPAWRDRTELLGYFNEFTKKFNETDFLRALYECSYFADPHVIVLDEMNIARVEYYFAEMLSVLEMPRSNEWLLDIIPSVVPNDPCLIHAGKMHVNENTWFVGTINNDDSTFAVADKVYDRAIPIDLDSKAAAFDAPETEPVRIRAEYLMKMFREAKEKYPVSQESLDKLKEMELYMIKHFRLAFGNRIMKQIHDFVPCYIACGGTEIDAIDFMIAKKILRKFESLSLGYIKDELQKFIVYINKNYGKTNMQICKEYIERIIKTS